MAIVFRLQDDAPDHPEVGHSNFKAHYPEVNHSMAWDELTPYIEQATDMYVIPFVGQAMYDEVVNAYQASGEDDLDAAKQHFLRLLQRAVAYYTVLHALPKKASVIASMGVVNNSPSGGALPVSQWSFKNTLWSVTKDADTFLDALLAYMQDNLSAFGAWKTSAAYKEGTADLFRQTRDFQAYHHIHNSHRTFLALVPYIGKAARKYLLPILGDTFWKELVAATEGGSPSTAQKDLADHVRRCLAEYTIHMAVPALTCVVEADGLKVVSSTDGMDTRSNAASAFLKEAPEAHRVAAEDNARTFRSDMIDYLFGNADTFPTWKDSAFFKQMASSNPPSVLGGKCGGVWM